MWVTYALLCMNFTAKKWNFMLLEVFPIVLSQIKSFKLFYYEQFSLYIETAEVYWSKSQTGMS